MSCQCLTVLMRRDLAALRIHSLHLSALLSLTAAVPLMSFRHQPELCQQALQALGHSTVSRARSSIKPSIKQSRKPSVRVGRACVRPAWVAQRRENPPGCLACAAARGEDGGLCARRGAVGARGLLWRRAAADCAAAHQQAGARSGQSGRRAWSAAGRPAAGVPGDHRAAVHAGVAQVWGRRQRPGPRLALPPARQRAALPRVWCGCAASNAARLRCVCLAA
jgi:hypothetical protein